MRRKPEILQSLAYPGLEVMKMLKEMLPAEEQCRNTILHLAPELDEEKLDEATCLLFCRDLMVSKMAEEIPNGRTWREVSLEIARLDEKLYALSSSLV